MLVLLRNESEKMKSPNDHTNDIAPATAKPGFPMGIEIRKNDLICEHPSISEASSISMGVARNVVLSRITENGMVRDALAKMTEIYVLMSPTPLNMMNNGVTRNTVGSICATRNTSTIAEIHLFFNLAKAKPVKDERNNESAVLSVPMIMLLMKYLIPPEERVWMMGSSVTGLGIRVGGRAYTSRSVLKLEIYIHRTGIK
jgi:hypothetical protein